LKDFVALYVRFASLGEEKSLQKTICVSLRARAICQDIAMKQVFSYTFWVAKTCKRRIIYS